MIVEPDDDDQGGADWAANDELGNVIWCAERRHGKR